MATTIITRHCEPTFQYTVTASGARGAREDVAGQLSTPEFYNGPEGLCIQHQDSYSVRLKVCTVF